MRKNLRELTENEAKEILEFVYPKKDYWFTGLSFEPIVDEQGRQQMTFGFRSIIGIKFHDGQDNCILHFDNTKAVLWLYKNGYEIEELLEENKHLTQMETQFDNFAFEIHFPLYKTEKDLSEGKPDTYNYEKIIKNIDYCYKRYYLKDYEK